jgi:hypothetical protein
MRRMLTIGALILAGLSLHAPPAQAKGQAEICGANSCTQLYGTETKPAVNILTQAGRARLSPAAPTQFFSIRFVNQPGSPLAYWMPTANRLRVGWERAIWIRATKVEAALLRAKTHGLRPLSAPKSVSVAVNLKLARGARLPENQGGQTRSSGSAGSSVSGCTRSTRAAVATAPFTSRPGNGNSTFAQTPSPRPRDAPSTAESRCINQRSTPRVGTAMTSVSIGSPRGALTTLPSEAKRPSARSPRWT